MKRQIYQTNENGYIKKIHVAEFDEQGNCLEGLEENIIATQPPQGLYRAKWTGTEWIEGMSQKEINELNAPIDKGPTMEEYLLDLDYRISSIELGL